MRYHLDTSFLVDWQREDPRVEAYVDGILSGEHRVSMDGVCYVEFMAARLIPPRKRIVIGTVLRVGDWMSLDLEAARVAAAWLSKMSDGQRRAHLADAMITAVSHVGGATLLTGDRTASGIFPAEVELYK